MHYLSFLIFFLAGIYTVWDSLQRGRSHISSLLWGMGVTFLFFVFFPLHLATRPKLSKKSTIDVTDDIEVACPKCHHYYKPNANFCPNCGWHIKGDE
ncbi:zinc ribbon domain-containing protein [Desulfofalx alkaliphila]|uniref:zinc ribbon domain-containing protein n=1 Tax=Desulfofalx alkaliphila TaxID=105483 RepID=UPI000B18235B|nr:zinc ribbon domain-containing protein [Desulfofalx alkaliphila]